MPRSSAVVSSVPERRGPHSSSNRGRDGGGEPPTPTAVLVPIKRASAELSVGRKFLTGLGDKGVIRVVRMGRKLLIPRMDVDRLAREGAPHSA